MFKNMENLPLHLDDFKLNNSTEISNKPTLLKRARSKYFTLGLMFNLVDLDSPLTKKYWNTYHCTERLEQRADKITSKYCRNRWCLVCNRIRTANLINLYKPELDTWKEKHFVTLTIPNVSADDLANTIDDMLSKFVNIKRTMKIRRKIVFIGLRKLEVTYNPITNTYHPHFHLIVYNYEMGETLISEWLKRYPNATRKAQDIIKADDKSCIELFKYFTKIISSKSAKLNKDSAPIEYRRKIYIRALDTIFRAVEGRRTFQTFGFNAPVQIDSAEVVKPESSVTNIYVWETEISDWLSLETGEVLTNYQPSTKMIELIENDIVTKDYYQIDLSKVV